MKGLRNKKLLLIGIVLLAFFLRFYRVAEVPPALSWDEVSIGYNAYSILRTGKDEHGVFLPLDTFAGFGDYKPPVSIYLTVPFIFLFGLQELSVRLPSVIAGTVAVLLTFILVKELFRKDPHREIYAILSAFVLALSPWHINISRAGFEANIATMLIIFGMVLLIKSKIKNKLRFVCWLPFVAAIYTFNSARYFAPFIGIGFVVWQRNLIRNNIKYFVGGLLIAWISLIPIAPHLLSKEARLRFAEVNIFSDISVVTQSNERIAADGNTALAKIIHNRRIGYAQKFLKHYLDHFEPSFLFIKGDGNPKFSIQDVGQMYIVELPLMIAGLLFMFKKYPTQGIFLLFWLLAAILPAATARETPHALRILTTLPTWQIFIAMGIFSFINFFQSKRNQHILFGVGLASIYFVSTVYYLHNYYNQYPYEYSGEWQYGYKQAIEFVKEVENDYEQIVISDVIGRPYAYALFYTQYDPGTFLTTKDASFDAAGFYNVYGFGKYRFVRSSPTEYSPNVLYILPPENIPPEGTILKTVHLLNGKPVLQIFKI